MSPAELHPVSVARLTDNWQALSYLAEAMAEDDPACLAFALAVLAHSRGVCLVAMVPAGISANAPDGALVGLTGEG
jgi:DNA-binding phage protein